MTRLVLAVFRVLMRMLPERFRQEHGPLILAALGEALDEARVGGAVPMVRVGFVAVADLVRRTGHEHWRVREGANRRERRMASLPSDVRYAIRGFVRQPGSSGLLVLTLALAMASAMAVFGLIDGLLLRPLPFHDAGQLVYLDETAPRWNLESTSINYADFDAWRRGVRTFEGLGLFVGSSVNLATESGPDRVLGADVTFDLAKVLGIEPILGRLFTAEDDRPGGLPVVLLGEALWRTRFGAAGNVVGQQLRINGEPHTVVGVLPRSAAFPEDFRLWRPLRVSATANSESYSYQGIGRLRAGVSLAAAREDLLQAQRPIWAASDTAHIVSPVAFPLRDYLSREWRLMTSAVAVGVLLVLLCACANVASSMLARAIFRQREIALRVALGADPGRVGRQMLIESFVLAGVAGVIGMVVGQWALGLFARALPDELPSWLTLSPDWITALGGVAIVGLTALIFGLAPALQARRQDPKAALAGAGGRASLSRSQRRLLNGFVIAEVGLAVVLLVGGGLLFRAFQRVRQTDPGLRVNNVLSFRLTLPAVRYPDSVAIGGFHRRLLGDLRGLPGVRQVGLMNCPPLSGCHEGNFFEADGAAPRAPGAASPVTLTLRATDGAAEALGISLRHGRTFAPQDGEFGAERVALVSEEFARGNWPGVADPTGRRIRFNGSDSTTWVRVIGVVGDVRHYGLDKPPRPTVYLPVGRRNADALPGFAVLIRTERNPSAQLDAVRSLVRALDPELPVFAVGTMEEALNKSLGVWRVIAAVLALFAAMALALSIGGVYAVLGYVVGRRRTELGVRLALGAPPASVVRLVIREGTVLISIGLAVGLPIAIIAAKVLAGQVAGLVVGDLPVWVGAIVILLVTGTLAAAVPGRRAATVDPRTTLAGE